MGFFFFFFFFLNKWHSLIIQSKSYQQCVSHWQNIWTYNCVVFTVLGQKVLILLLRTLWDVFPFPLFPGHGQGRDQHHLKEEDSCHIEKYFTYSCDCTEFTHMDFQWQSSTSHTQLFHIFAVCFCWNQPKDFIQKAKWCVVVVWDLFMSHGCWPADL